MKPSLLIISLIFFAGTYLACQNPQPSGTNTRPGEVDSTPAHATALPVNTSHNRILEPKGIEWLTINGFANDSIQIAIPGYPRPGTLALFAADTTSIRAFSDATDSGVYLNYRLHETGTFFVAVSNTMQDSEWKYTIIYQTFITRSRVIPAQITDTLTIGVQTSRSIDSTDTHWMAIALEKDKHYLFKAVGVKQMWLFDSLDESLCLESDCNPGSRDYLFFSMIAPKSGVYSLRLFGKVPWPSGAAKITVSDAEALAPVVGRWKIIFSWEHTLPVGTAVLCFYADKTYTFEDISGTWDLAGTRLSMMYDNKVIQTGNVSAQLMSGTMVQPDVPDYTGVWSAVKLRY